MSQLDLVEIIGELQRQMCSRGASAYHTLSLAFALNDRDGTRVFDFSEVEAILARAGLFLKRQQLTKLYRYFDKLQNETVVYTDILDAIRGPLSSRRLRVIRQLFSTLDTARTGRIAINSLLDTFDTKRHPLVLSGAKKEKDILKEMQTCFDSNAGALQNGYLTEDDFIQIYHGISATIPYDDDYFVNLIERVWHVSDGVGGALSSVSPLVVRVGHIVREKVRQKTNSTGSEIESLRLNFKYFDTKQTGFINYANFKNALQRFGIYLDEKTTADLFQEFDLSNNGTMNYLQFTLALYADSPEAANYKNKLNASFSSPASLPSTQQRSYIDTPSLLLSSPSHAAPLLTQKSSDLSSTKKLTVAQREREASLLPTVVFLVGAPSSGRTTQSFRVVHEFNFIHLDVADLLEQERLNAASEFGARIDQCLKEGVEVPTLIVVRILWRNIQEKHNSGSLYFIIDGFPSNIEQRETWSKVVGAAADTPFTMYLEVSPPLLQQRYSATALLNRGKQVASQLMSAFQDNVNQFAANTIPVIQQYGAEGRLRVVDGNGSVDQVYQQVRAIIAEL